MQKQIDIVYKNQRFIAYWNGKSSYVVSNNISFEVFYEQDEEINGSVFHVITVNLKGDLVKLVYNPVCDNYWLCNMSGAPWLAANNIYKPIKCDTLKYITFPISKNGCSCLLKSALHYDNHISQEVTNSEKFIWENPQVFSKVRMENSDRENFVERYKDYKKFIVLQPENERFIRFLNWSHKQKYNVFYNFNLSLEDSRKEHEWSMPLITINPYYCDQHALSQDAHIEQYVNLFYNGDKSEFDKDVEIVQLKDLPEWFAETFKAPMIMNNIDKPEDWLYKF